jgi:hypothetical protein
MQYQKLIHGHSSVKSVSTQSTQISPAQRNGQRKCMVSNMLTTYITYIIDSKIIG